MKHTSTLLTSVLCTVFLIYVNFHCSCGMVPASLYAYLKWIVFNYLRGVVVLPSSGGAGSGTRVFVVRCNLS